MQITDVTIHPCTQRMRDAQWKFARAAVPAIDGQVLALRDDAGHVGLGYAHAIPSITTHGADARSSLELLAPLLRGRSPADLAALMEEVERTLAGHHSVKAAVDMALHDLLARRLGVPLHVLLGGAMHAQIQQSRILPIKTPAEMAALAAGLAEQGYGQLKIKLSGDLALDTERVASVRAAAGPAVLLTLDPNQAYDAKRMMAAFARMERHDIALVEQPVPAHDWAGLALLTRSLPAAIEADESAGSVHDVFRLVSERVVDAVNLKITKLGGFRRFVEAVRICEAGGVVCRVGAAFGPALLQAMQTQAASMVRALPYGCELSEHLQLLDDPFTGLDVQEGKVVVPTAAGCGVQWAAA